jgi:hypothetical protein
MTGMEHLRLMALVMYLVQHQGSQLKVWREALLLLIAGEKAAGATVQSQSQMFIIMHASPLLLETRVGLQA